VAALRFGILGAAKIAPAALIKPATRTGGVAEVVAVAAREPAKARAFASKHGIKSTPESYDALLADPDVDAVYNPLPNGLHGRYTLAALEAGKHVLCEKPFTANADEARQVADAARSSGLVVMEAFHYRHHPLADRLHEIVAGGELGDIERIEIAFSAPLAKRGDIRYQWSLAGGALMDMGCYTIHLLRLLSMGEPTVTSARAKLSSPRVDRAMRVEYELPGGGSAVTACSMFSSSVLRMHARVRGVKGTLKVFNPFAPQFANRVRIRTGGTSRTEHATRRPTYDFQLEHFVAAVREGAPVTTTADDAVKTMAIIDAGYTAAGLEPRQPT
jgi:predicted dehydrogenase